MATLSNTYGITLVVGTSSTEYGGASSNQFFGGSSDRIAMLRFDPPSALGANQVISDADITAWFKADTTASADYIWIGLITSAWNSTTTNYATLYSYLTTTADAAYLSVTTTAQQMALAINSILQVWASDPSAYSGLYFRRQGGLGMTRIGGTGAVINTTVQTTTACNAPTYTSLSKTAVDPGEPSVFSWSGASGGTLNAITGYIVEFQYSDDGGSTWSAWAVHETVYTSNAYGSSIVTGGSFGSIVRVRVKTIGSAGASYYSDPTNYLTYTTNSPTDCGSPTKASLNKTVAETAPTLTYSGASAGALNTISGYEIEYAESSNNSTWGNWTALKTVNNTGTSGTTTVNLSSTRGHYRKYRIRTQGSAGSSYYSDWKETTSCRYNSLPTAPTVFTASPAVYVSGTIALAYSGATDADNNISTYNVQYATSADGTTWGSWVSLPNGATSHTPTLSPGHYIKYQVRTVDAFSQVSTSWKASNICGKNTAPAAPVVTYPQNSKTIYNSRPRFLVTMGADPESHTMTLAASGFTLSRSSGLVGGSKIIARRTSAASAGAVSISATATDQYGESSSAAARSTTYAAASFTDDPVTAGTTPIKAAHMTELRTMIDTIRLYYGFGTNLIPGTSNSLADCSVGTYTGEIVTYTSIASIGLTVGDALAVGAYLKPAGTRDLKILVVFYEVAGVALELSTRIVGNTITKTSEGYSYGYGVIPASATQFRVFIYNGSGDVGTTTEQYKEMKLERGTISTPWSSGTGSTAVNWAETITAGVTKARNWADHVVEMQSAIDDVVDLVNRWDTSSSANRITAPVWITPGAKPTAAVMEQIRGMIEVL